MVQQMLLRVKPECHLGMLMIAYMARRVLSRGAQSAEKNAAAAVELQRTL